MIGIPAEEFSLQHAVAHRDVARMPEGVATGDVAALEHAVVHVLERVLARELYVGAFHVARVQHEIVALRRAVTHGEVAGKPSEFVGNNVAVAHGDVAAFAQGLDAVQLRVFNVYVFRIPQRGATVFRNVAVAYGQAAHMPERIAQIAHAAFRHNVFAFLHRAFAVRRAGERTISDARVAKAVQRPFFVKRLAFYCFHNGDSPRMFRCLQNIVFCGKRANTYAL